MSGRSPGYDLGVHSALELPGIEVVDGVGADAGDLEDRCCHVHERTCAGRGEGHDPGGTYSHANGDKLDFSRTTPDVTFYGCGC